MYFTEDKTSMIDDLLNRICVKLQIPSGLCNRVEEEYDILRKNLQKENGISGDDANLYSQGSYV